MSIIADRRTRTLLLILAGALLSGTLLGQVIAWRGATVYRQALLAHDAAVAGRLALAGVNRAAIADSITVDVSAESTDAMVAVGQALLAAAGYDERTRARLLPGLSALHGGQALATLLLWLLAGAAVLGAVVNGERRRVRGIERAEGALRAFMAGSVDMRLDDRAEGSLSRLYATVNALVTAQAAHIDRAQRDRAFLRDTIADISHQLKTPLAALRMYSEIIREEAGDAPVVSDFAAKSERELDRMETLIQNLLKLARLDAHAIDLEPREIGVRAYLEELLLPLHARAQREQKTLTLQCDPAIVGRFDATWLQEAVGNVAKNALDHTGPGDRVTIQVDETPLLITISVADTGAGIHPEDIHHIFKRFYRSRFSSDRQGAGIGLALALAIIESHGGSISVESELGRGATFRISLPRLAGL
ncbi:MAG: sensor histidine kinase [Anaerolineae bacterium]